MSPDLSDAQAAELAGELREVVARLARRFRSEATLPIPQMAVLGRLEREGPSTTSRLAALEQVRPQSMAHTIGELEAAGLVDRSPDPSDGRQVLIRATARGVDALADFRRVAERWASTAIAVELTQAERDVLREATRVMRRILGEGPPRDSA